MQEDSTVDLDPNLPANARSIPIVGHTHACISRMFECLNQSHDESTFEPPVCSLGFISPGKVTQTGSSECGRRATASMETSFVMQPSPCVLETWGYKNQDLVP